MSGNNPIFGFIGRSNSRSSAMLVAPSFIGGLPTVLQSALAMGNEDPTAKHLASYAETLQRRTVSAGLPTDENWCYHAERLYAKSSNGIAFIPVWGMLFNKCGWACAWFTGYDYLADAYAAALADPAVNAIVFDVDSFGGEVQGCMELAETIYANRSKKPTMAIANANACSAGFAIASAAGRVSAIPSSMVGSVGVLQIHFDYSGYLDKAGVKVTLLYEGEHKVDGNPYEPLPDSVRKERQAGLAKHYGRFVGLVSKHRSMSADAVRDTEARVYDGPEALDIGFVDAVELPMAAVLAFSNELSGSQTKEYAMTTPQKPGAQAPEQDKPAASGAPATTESTAASPAAAPSASDERSRIKAILSSDEAKGRNTLAEHLAFNTSMSVDDAKAALAAAPKATEAKGGANPFVVAMNGSENPNVGASAGEGGEQGGGDAKKPAADMLQAYSQATGHKFD